MQSAEQLLKRVRAHLAYEDRNYTDAEVAAQIQRWLLEAELDAKAEEAPTSADQETQAVGLSAARNFMSTCGTVAINARGRIGIITAHAKVDGCYEGYDLMTGEPWFASSDAIMVGKFEEFLGQNTGAPHWKAWFAWLAKARGWKVEDGPE